MSAIVIEGPLLGKTAVCMPILRALPGWFGLEESLVQYAGAIEKSPTFLAYDANSAVGFITLKQHNPYSAEVYVMGILPEMHRRGIGRMLMEQSFAWLKGQKLEYVQVKTLAPSHPDAGYANTRAFYKNMGFRPLEEFKQIWDEQNPCLIMIRGL